MADLSNEEANDLADEILSREEFLLTTPEPGPAQDVINWIGEQISRVFEFLGNLFGGVGGAAGRGFAIILLALAAGVLVFAIYRAVSGRPPKAEKEDVGARVVFDEVVEPAELRAQLASLKAASDWRGAVIAGFRLAVVSLIDEGVAREIAGATTGDFARAVEARRPELLDVYSPASASFERAFYSDLEIHRDDLSRVEQLLGRLSSVGAK